MSKNLDFPIRMCIICKERQSQKKLFRFQIIQGCISPFTKKGRSLYLCQNCIGNEKSNKILQHKYKIKENIQEKIKQLKEIATNG